MKEKEILPVSQKSIRELKHQRRRQLQKSRLKSEFALPQTLSRLFILFNLSNVGKFFGVDSSELYQSSRKEQESCCLVFPSSTKREIKHFHVLVMQRRLRNVPRTVLCTCKFVVLPI